MLSSASTPSTLRPAVLMLQAAAAGEGAVQAMRAGALHAAAVLEGKQGGEHAEAALQPPPASPAQAQTHASPNLALERQWPSTDASTGLGLTR